jgi:hypothetical protein
MPPPPSLPAFACPPPPPPPLLHLLLTPPLLQAAAAARITHKPDIFFAAADGDIALVLDHLLVDPTLVNARNDRSLTPVRGLACFVAHLACRNETPLHFSAAAGHAYICELLLHGGTNVNAKSKRCMLLTSVSVHCGYQGVFDIVCSNWTPLFLSAFYGHLGVCRLLVKWRADTAATNRCVPRTRTCRISLTPRLAAMAGLHSICVVSIAAPSSKINNASC